MSSSAVPFSADVLRYAAFTDDPGGGNPAGVVLDARGLDEQRMLQIAQEVGYSETALLRPRREAAGAFDVRYFSPEAEVSSAVTRPLPRASPWPSAAARESSSST